MVIVRKDITAKRRNELSQMILSNGSVHIGEMAAHFGVSTETIRKDLMYLENLGIVRKSYGGAVAANEVIERPFSSRAGEHVEEKNEIARLAQRFLPERGSVFLDAGSTVHAFAKLITLREGLTIYTNSMGAADLLAQTNNTVCLVGGEVRGVTMSLAGFWAVNAIRSVRMDVAFLGTSGFGSYNGPCAEAFVEAEVKRAVVESSRKSIVLADHTKFRSEALVEYTDWKQIDCLVTDAGTTAKEIERLKTMVEVINK